MGSSTSMSPETLELEEHAAGHIARGALVRVLEDWCPPFDGFFLYYPSRRHQPPAPVPPPLVSVA